MTSNITTAKHSMRAITPYLMGLPLMLVLGCVPASEVALFDDSALPALDSNGDDDIRVAANEPLPLDDEGCPGIYAQDLLPEFHITVDPAVMSALYEDWVHGLERNRLDQNDNPYHPLAEFRYGDVIINDAAIRLRGNPIFWLEQNKMQFQIAFDRHSPDGRFLGQRKVLFDAATFNRHFFRDRLSLYFMRQLGLPAPCANNAKLYLNGEYYGLFTSIEKVDDVFVQRVFPGSDQVGDLWKRLDYELKTNHDTATNARLSTLLAAAEAGSLSTVETYLDIDQALRVAAAEAILPDSDGFWAGGLNYYLYDDPVSGKFVIIPWDLDNTFTRLEVDVDP